MSNRTQTIVLNGEIVSSAPYYTPLISFTQAPKGRDQNPSGLGRAIINRKVKDARKAQESGLVSYLAFTNFMSNT